MRMCVVFMFYMSSVIRLVMRKICFSLIIACVCSCSYERKKEKVDIEFKDQFIEQEKPNKKPEEFEKEKISERMRYVNSIKFDDLDSLFLEGKITSLEYTKRVYEHQRENEQGQLHSSEAIEIIKGRDERRKQNLGTEPFYTD